MPHSILTELTPAPTEDKLPTPPEDTLPMHAATAHTMCDYHLAWHGTAVNLDTGHITEYPKLS